MTMRIATALLSVIATLLAITPALAGAKDESAAEWLFPKAFNDWRNGLADRGLALGGTYVGDNIANLTGGISKGAIHFGRLDLAVDADLEALRLVGRQVSRQHVLALRPRALAQLHRQYCDYQRDRGAARYPSVRSLYRAELWGRRADDQGRPTGRRYRILRQPDR
jgi:hypothetical protein